jgi:hypothetical protein
MRALCRRQLSDRCRQSADHTAHTRTRRSFLVFLPPDGPGQLATGSLITFFFLLINLICRPFCTEGLNNLQSCSLISQFLTLFCGILIGYMESMAGTGSDSSEKEDTSVFGSIIVMINVATLVFPILRKFLSGKHVELWGTLIFLVRLPVQCYLNWCGGQKRHDARIAKERAERQAARYESRSQNTTVNANVAAPRSPTPIVISGALSGMYFIKDCAYGAELVMVQDANDKQEETAGNRRSPLKAAMAESNAEPGANGVEYPPSLGQWYSEYTRMQERLKSQRMSTVGSEETEHCPLPAAPLTHSQSAPLRPEWVSGPPRLPTPSEEESDRARARERVWLEIGDRESLVRNRKMFEGV